MREKLSSTGDDDDCRTEEKRKRGEMEAKNLGKDKRPSFLLDRSLSVQHLSLQFTLPPLFPS